MARIIPTSLAAALPLALFSQAALADLTPSETWGDWKQYMQSMGYTVEGTESMEGANLTVSDVRMVAPMPEGGGSFDMALDSVSFNQNSDGSVAVVMPEEMPMMLDIPASGDEGKPVKMTITYTQTGHSMTAAGTAQDITYTYDAATVGVTLDDLQVGPDTFGEENAKLVVTGTDMTSTTRMTVDTLRNYEQTGTLASLTYDVFINNPEDPNQLKLTGGLGSMTFEGGGAIPLMLTDASDMAAMLASGFDVTGNFSYTDGNSMMAVTDPENGNFSSTTSSTGGNLGIEMGAGGLSYSGGQQDVSVNVQADTMPFPVDFSMAESAFNLTVPVSKAEEPQDFAFGLTLGEFEMSDMIWSIFDSQNRLPRDPATIMLDLSGKARLLTDLLAPDAAAQMAGEAPGELESLTVNSLVVDAVGAKLEGSGDVTFDNSDMTSFNGMPKPVGEVNLMLAGGNALLDNLVAMGIVPQEQATGARMMMGLFAVPGDAPDTLTSKIEFTQEGQVLANGQRIK
jgi:hypothetical protein